MRNGVVTGLDKKVIAAPIGILARNGSASGATPNISTPGIRKKMPTNRPSAVPRGTDVRVKPHKRLFAKRSANGTEHRPADRFALSRVFGRALLHLDRLWQWLVDP